MNFLVTNDDGLFAPGVRALVEVLNNFGTVFVCCPDQERSAISHSITLRKPLNIQKNDLFGQHVTAWMIDGTPADCVKLALDILIDEPIDFVFSGINLGANIGKDVFYSGTISAAIEAATLQYKSIAVSIDAYDAQMTNFKQAKLYLYQLLQELLQQPLTVGTVYNINLPYVAPELYQGVTVAKLDFSIERYKHIHIQDGQGKIFYWLKDHRRSIDTTVAQSDFALLAQGYTTITPITISHINDEQFQHTTTLIKGAK